MGTIMENRSAETAVRLWLDSVVVGLDLCPFAKPVMRSGAFQLRSIEGDLEACLKLVAQECALFDQQPELETSLLILDAGFEDFEDYLDLVAMSEALMTDIGYDGVYQLASFHPDYQFDGSAQNAIENYTNRAPYPIIQLLRESSITRALNSFENPDSIPERNMQTMRELGFAGIEHLLGLCTEKK